MIETLLFMAALTPATAATMAGPARPSIASDDFLLDLHSAQSEVPPSVMTLLEDKFLGIDLARDLGCSAIADVAQYDGAVIGVAIVFDVDARRTLRCEPMGNLGGKRAIFGGWTSDARGQSR